MQRAISKASGDHKSARLRVGADSVGSTGSRVLTTGNRGHIPRFLRPPLPFWPISLSHGPPFLSRYEKLRIERSGESPARSCGSSL